MQNVKSTQSLTEGERGSEESVALPETSETTAGQGLCDSPCSAFLLTGQVYGINELEPSLKLITLFWIFVIGIVGITILYPSKFGYLSSRIFLIFAYCLKACCHGICFVRFIPKFCKQICKIIARQLHVRKLRFKLLIGRLYLRYLLLKKFFIVHTGGWKKFDLPNVKVHTPLPASASDETGVKP